MDPKKARILKENMPYQYSFREIDQMQQDLAEEEGILSEDEKRIQQDLKQTYQKNLHTLEVFLSNEYANFQNKVFNCMYKRCYQDIYAQRQDIRNCQKLCSQGIQKIQEFTEKQFKQTHETFNECMQGSQKAGYTLEGAVKCHDKLIAGLDNIKLNVRTEFNYYQ